MAIQEGYLSTSLRWALFKADWPEGEIKFHEADAQSLNIPSSFSKTSDEKFCVAEITRFPSDPIVITAYKSQSDAGKIKDSDAWHVLCSKAMGRALKKAGYPDTIDDLRTMTKYINAGKEEKPVVVNAISSGSANNSVTYKTTVAGQQVTTPVVAMESKERPSKPTTDWASDIEREEAHRNFKIRSNDLNEEEKEELRSEHAKLNNRQWPMSRGELNTLVVLLEGMHAAREGFEEEVHDAEEDEADLFNTDGLKSLFEMLDEEVRLEVIAAFGEPDKWADKIPEHEYTQMVDMFTVNSAE